MTNTDEILVAIRSQLARAITESDRMLDEKFFDVLDTLLDTAYEEENREQAGILEDLRYCFQHIVMGVFFKARGELPSEDAIRAAFSNQANED